MAGKDPIAALDNIARLLDKRVGDILWDNLTRLRDHLRAHDGLKKRNRGLPYVRKPIHLQGTILDAGLYSPPPWSHVHIGPAGKTTTITPKKGQFLAIPTDFVRSFRGHPVGAKQYGGTVIFGGIIWGKAGWYGGGAAGQRRAAGEKLGRQTLVPLFILKKSVVVAARIHPEQLIAWIKPQFMADLKKYSLVQA
jgi:hypothetical protein